MNEVSEKSMAANWIIFFLALVAIGFLGITDHITGPEISFSIFYLIPITVGTWLGGSTIGILLSLVAGIVWLISDITATGEYSNALVPYWNSFVRLCTFLAVSQLVYHLKKSAAKEKELARIDSLTGLRNSKAFFEFVFNEIERARRHKRPLSLAYVDVDNFKVVNDTYGHRIGDSLLRVASNVLANQLRSVDMAARLGGDEFVLLLSETDAENALPVMERIQKDLLSFMQDNKWPVTFSIGLATYRMPPASVDEAIGDADTLMYQAKKRGKNNIVARTF